MKIIKHFFLLSFIFVLTTSCAHSSQATGAGAVEQFYRFLQSGNLEKAYSMLSKNDQEYITSGDFIGDTESQQLINKKYWSHAKYKILSIRRISDNIAIKVELTTPNLGEILGEEIADSLIKINYENSRVERFDEQKRTSLLFNRLYNNEFSYITFNETLHVLTEGNQQKIFLNLKRSEEIFKLIQEAIWYGKENKYDLALEKLKKVLALDPENSLANQYIEIIQKEKK